jgi:hypothetical protein
MLALFDVLGFSHRVSRDGDGVAKTLAIYRDLIETAVLEPARSCMGTVVTPEGRVMTIFSLPVRYAYFSDTILLWVPLQQVFAAAFVTRCADLMCHALRKEVPLRGAISLGEAVMHKASNTYIGEPLIEAAGLEKGQNWVGLALGESATWPPFIAELDGPSIIEYPAPMKEKYAKYASPVVVDWPRIWRDSQKDSAGEYLSRINKDKEHALYYENAGQFVDYSLQHHEWYKNPDAIPSDAKLKFISYAEYKKAQQTTPKDKPTRTGEAGILEEDG